MTKTKLLRLFRAMEQDDVIFKLYDEMLMQLELTKHWLEPSADGRRYIEEHMHDYVLYNYTVADLVRSLEGAETINDRVFTGNISKKNKATYAYTFRDVYQHINKLKASPEYIGKIIKESADKHDEFMKENEQRIEERHREITRLLGMYKYNLDGISMYA